MGNINSASSRIEDEGKPFEIVIKPHGFTRQNTKKKIFIVQNQIIKKRRQNITI